MAKKFDLLWHILDIPSGTVLGVMSGVFIAMTVVSFLTKGAFKVPDEFLSVYATAVTGVTVTKITAIRTEKKGATRAEDSDA